MIALELLDKNLNGYVDYIFGFTVMTRICRQNSSCVCGNYVYFPTVEGSAITVIWSKDSYPSRGISRVVIFFPKFWYFILNFDPRKEYPSLDTYCGGFLQGLQEVCRVDTCPSHLASLASLSWTVSGEP